MVEPDGSSPDRAARRGAALRSSRPGPATSSTALRVRAARHWRVPDASIVAIALSRRSRRRGRGVGVGRSEPLPRAARSARSATARPASSTDTRERRRRASSATSTPPGSRSSWPGTPPPLVTIDADDTVRSSDGMTWPLRIERHPDWLGDRYEGETPTGGQRRMAAPSLWTCDRAAGDRRADYRPPTIPVVAELAAGRHGDLAPAARRLVGGGERRRRDDPRPARRRPVAARPARRLRPRPDDAGRRRRRGDRRVDARRDGLPVVTAVFADGATTEVTIPPDVYVQSDGEFLWWTDGHDVHGCDAWTGRSSAWSRARCTGSAPRPTAATSPRSRAGGRAGEARRTRPSPTSPSTARPASASRSSRSPGQRRGRVPVRPACRRPHVRRARATPKATPTSSTSRGSRSTATTTPATTRSTTTTARASRTW